MKVTVRLSPGYYIAMAFFTLMWGLGLIIHFLVNNRVFPRYLDDEGITTRNGKRHLWENLVDWERHKLVLSGSNARITGNVTLLFSTGKVLIGTFPVENMDEVLSFLSGKLGTRVAPG